jgi:uncharacterized membrane protein YdjX (TVP38/TMEM64 family)
MAATDTVQSKKRQSISILIFLLFISLILILVLSKDYTKIKKFIKQSGWVGIVISIALYGLLGATPIPSEPLTVLLTTIYGPFLAMLLASLGNLLSALMEYFIGARIRDIASFDHQREKLPFGLGKFPVDSPIFLIAARNLPGYGPKFVSIIAGMYRVPIFRYIWTTLFSNFLGAAIVAYGGFGLLNLKK